MNGTTAVPLDEEMPYKTTEELFKIMDKDGDGMVDVNEMREFAKAHYGEETAEMEVQQVLQTYHQDESHKFTLEEVLYPPSTP